MSGRILGTLSATLNLARGRAARRKLQTAGNECRDAESEVARTTRAEGRLSCWGGPATTCVWIFVGCTCTALAAKPGHTDAVRHTRHRGNSAHDERATVTRPRRVGKRAGGGPVGRASRADPMRGPEPSGAWAPKGAGARGAGGCAAGLGS